MTCQSKEDAMDIDISKATNGHCPVIKKNGLLLYPVVPKVGGEGLPYAPINWPNPGDTWSWRVGKRTSVSGYYLDRYLYPPSRLQKSRQGKESFKSKLSVQEYIQALCPNVDVEAFFASFSWKVPSKQALFLGERYDATCMLLEEMTEESLSDCQNGDPACKAGNRFCRCLTEEANVLPVNTMFCDICCTEANFCRDCCCILCCKTIDLTLGGYSFIRCEAEVHDGLICGHSAHLVCASRCYMAGTVGGTIGLDAEYYCRRCDSKTGLVEHVTKILKTCESVESPGDVKKMLDLVVCLTRGSQKSDVKRLMNRAQRALQKFECRNAFSNIWEEEDDISTVKTDNIFEFPAMKISGKMLAKAAKKAAEKPVQSDILARPSTEERQAPLTEDVPAAQQPGKRKEKGKVPSSVEPGQKKRKTTGVSIQGPASTPEGEQMTQGEQAGELADSSATQSEEAPLQRRRSQPRPTTPLSTTPTGSGQGAQGPPAVDEGPNVERVVDLDPPVAQGPELELAARPSPRSTGERAEASWFDVLEQVAPIARSLRATQEAQNKKVAELENQVKEMTNAVAAAGKQLEEAEQAIVKAKADTSKMSELEAKVKAQEARIKELELMGAEREKEARDVKASFEAQLAESNAKVSKLEKEASASNVVLEDTLHQRDALLLQIMRMQKEIFPFPQRILRRFKESGYFQRVLHKAAQNQFALGYEECRIEALAKGCKIPRFGWNEGEQDWDLPEEKEIDPNPNWKAGKLVNTVVSFPHLEVEPEAMSPWLRAKFEEVFSSYAKKDDARLLAFSKDAILAEQEILMEELTAEELETRTLERAEALRVKENEMCEKRTAFRENHIRARGPLDPSFSRRPFRIVNESTGVCTTDGFTQIPLLRSDPAAGSSSQALPPTSG